MGNTHLDKVYEYNRLEKENITKREGYSGPYIYPKLKNFQKESIDYFQNKSLIEYNIQQMKKYKDRPCLGRRLKTGVNEKGEPVYENKYTYFSSSEVYNMCLNFSKNIHEKKDELIHKDSYNNTEFELIGIFAKNCTEWVVSDLGCQMDSITTATLYATLGPNAFKFICEQTQIKTIMVSPDLVKMLCELKQKFKLDNLKYAILFDLTTNCDSDSTLSELEKAGFTAYSFTKDFIKDNDSPGVEYEYGTHYLKGDVDWYEDDKDYMIVNIDGKNYRINADGYVAGEGWFDDGVKVGEEWYPRWKYVTSDGSLASGWTEIDGVWYFFSYDTNEMYTSRVVEGYFVDGNGTLMSEGWYNNWWWLDESKGEWQDNWLYIKSDGSVVTGWTEIDGYWYYFDDESGMMYSNRTQDGYFLTEDGTMATGGWYSDWYWIDESTGLWDYQWVYTYSDGSLASGWTEIDGSWYYFYTGKDSYELDGTQHYYWYSYMASEEYVDGYYLGSNGVMDGSATAAWYQDDNGWYFEDESNWYPASQWFKINGKWYYFNSEGYLE